jgi:polygalacturonase
MVLLRGAFQKLGAASFFVLCILPAVECAGESSTPRDAREAISISDFGAKSNASTDNHDAIQRAFDEAKTRQRPVAIPAGVFGYSGTLVADGISVFAMDRTATLQALDRANEAIVLTGRGVTIAGLAIVGAGTKRLSTFESGIIWVRQAENAAVLDLRISGSSSVGIVIDDSARVRISGNSIDGTLADSIHLTNGSSDVQVERNRIHNSGDDGISVVSYHDRTIVHDVVIDGNQVIANRWGRGISVVGGERVRISNNTVQGGAADRAGIYIAAEKQWGTNAVREVQVTRNTLDDAGGRSSGHGAVTVYNSYDDGPANDGISIQDNTIRNPRAAPVSITGSGPQQIEVRGNRIYMRTHAPIVANGGARSRVNEDNNSLQVPSAPRPAL